MSVTRAKLPVLELAGRELSLDENISAIPLERRFQSGCRTGEVDSRQDPLDAPVFDGDDSPHA